MALTDKDRALITEKSPGDETTAGWEYALLHRTVEQIVARHVAEARAAALNELADRGEGWVALESSSHLPEKNGIGCICGFCVWSPEHVAVMSFREGMPRAIRNLAATPPP